MVLAGWIAPTQKDTRVLSNGESTSSAHPAVTEIAGKSDGVGESPEKTGTKRKLSEIPEIIDKPCSSRDVGDQVNPHKVEDNDDDDGVLVILDENPETKKKKKRLQ